MKSLDSNNYQRGFLVDDELMAGVSQDPDNPKVFVAFVLRHTTGEYLGYQAFGQLQDALDRINQIPRPWIFERTGECNGCKDGQGCGKKEGSCKKSKCAQGSCQTALT